MQRDFRRGLPGAGLLGRSWSTTRCPVPDVRGLAP